MGQKTKNSNSSEPTCYLIIRRYIVAEQFQSRFRLLRYEKAIREFLQRMLPNVARIFLDDKALVLLYWDNGFAPKDLPFNVWKGLNNIVHGKSATTWTDYLFSEYQIFKEDMEFRDALVEYRANDDSWKLLS